MLRNRRIDSVTACRFDDRRANGNPRCSKSMARGTETQEAINSMVEPLENIPEGEGDALLFALLRLGGFPCHSGWWTQMHVRFAMEKKKSR